MGLRLFCPNCGSALEDTYKDFNAELKELKRGNTISLEMFEKIDRVEIGGGRRDIYKDYKVVDESKSSFWYFMSSYCRDFPGKYRRDAEDYMFNVIRREKTGKKRKYYYKYSFSDKKEAISEVERIYITMDDQFRKFPHNRINLIHTIETHNCPVCGGEIKQIRNVYNRDDKTTKYYLSSISDRIGSSGVGVSHHIFTADKLNSFCEENFDKEECRKEAEQYIDACSIVPNSTKADLTKLDITVYVNQLVNIESAILSMVDDLTVLLMKKRRIGRMATYLNKTISSDLQSETDEADLRNQKELNALERKYNLIFLKPVPGELGLKEPVKKQAVIRKVEIPIYKKPGLFNKKKVSEENERLRREFEAALEAAKQVYRAEVEENNRRYEAEMAEYNKILKVKMEQETAKRQAIIDERRLKKEAEEKKLLEERKEIEEKRNNLAAVIEKEIAENPIILLDAMLDKEIEEAKEEIKKLCDCKAQLAALGMYPKYLNIVALTTMAEYLETGRCSELTGADGAYNLYESEIRANRIVAQLDQIIDSLETIKANQYNTYRVLNSISYDTGRMVSTIDRMAHSLENIDANTGAIKDNTEVIAYNTAKTAHYAKVNTQLTNALGFMMALK